MDGQNLFYSARSAFGYTYPNYDVRVLAKRICDQQKWKLTQVRFYTGVPRADVNPRWYHFWIRKLAAMGRQGVVVFSRPLRYRNRTVSQSDGTQHSFLIGEEKGIDVRIAIDVIGLAHNGAYDVALIVSQDQDFSEVADEIRTIAQRQGRWIKIASAFPQSPTTQNRRGINNTDWIPINRDLYDQCLDQRNYLQKPSSQRS
ncbi:MAG: NYN domain-containing protein [Candidatus Poribacteria bacterium]|nr:NYN domain-containing protein [Candidatus Poribacteria bacterium]